MCFRISIIIFILSITTILFSQTDETLFSINRKGTSKAEFAESLNKNIPVSLIKNKDSVKQYLNNYIEFKLKVKDAENKGYDKKQEFKDELEKYRKQLALSYLFDREIIKNLASEAYERMKTEVRVRQILVKIDLNASPTDSIIAFQKALKILKRLSNGENFEELAKQVSDDPQAAITGGDLWYIGPFIVPYKLENYLYETNQLKYSNPIRTYLGYHIVEILDKRSNPGSYKVAHILISFPGDTIEKLKQSSKHLADSIYQLLLNGQDFAKLAAKYSNDVGTSLDRGELPWFETGKMPHEFELAAYAIKIDGAISKPVKTRYGWHIIKRISQKGIPTYQQIEEQLIQRISTGERGEIALQKNMDKLKKEYQFNDFNSLSSIIDLVDSTIFISQWKIPEYSDLSIPLFSIDNQKYTQNDFAKYLENTQKKMYPIPLGNYIIKQYEEYIKQCMISYQEMMLEKKDKRFNKLFNEFREGILHYEIMQNEIWDKITIDNSGLADYYKQNKDLYNKFQADVSVFDFDVNESSKIEKSFRKLKNLGKNDSSIVSVIQNSIDRNFRLDKKMIVVEGKIPIIDKCISMIKSGEIEEEERLIVFENEKKLIWLNNEITKNEIELDEIKDKVLSDYQNYIEKLWVSDLKKKYNVEINETVFESLFNN